MPALTPLLTHDDSPKRHLPAVAKHPFIFLHNYTRDLFTTPTWLLIGAFLSILLCSLPLRPTLIYGPVLLTLLYKITRALLTIFGFLPNHYLDGVIPGKHAAVLPNADGSWERRKGEPPGGGQVAVFLLNVRSNHPLGVLAPGYKELFIFYRKMIKELAANAESTGFLGSKNWVNLEERTTHCEKMTVFYFRSLDKVHQFAHSPAHREGWSWWSHHARQYPHLGFSHEAYEVPAGRWENIYDQCQPTGLGTASVPVRAGGEPEKGEKEVTWVRTVVDANRGMLRTHKGRMGESDGGENVRDYGEGVDPYDV